MVSLARGGREENRIAGFFFDNAVEGRESAVLPVSWQSCGAIALQSIALRIVNSSSRVMLSTRARVVCALLFCLIKFSLLALARRAVKAAALTDSLTLYQTSAFSARLTLTSINL